MQNGRGPGACALARRCHDGFTQCRSSARGRPWGQSVRRPGWAACAHAPDAGPAAHEAGGYLDDDSPAAWTWDDDYNPGVLVSSTPAATWLRVAASRQLPRSPRPLPLSRAPASPAGPRAAPGICCAAAHQPPPAPAARGPSTRRHPHGGHPHPRPPGAGDAGKCSHVAGQAPGVDGLRLCEVDQVGAQGAEGSAHGHAGRVRNRAHHHPAG